MSRPNRFSSVLIRHRSADTFPMRRSAQPLARDDAAVALGVIYQHIEDVEAKGVFRLYLMSQNTKNDYMPSQGEGAYVQSQDTTIDSLQRVGYSASQNDLQRVGDSGDEN